MPVARMRRRRQVRLLIVTGTGTGVGKTIATAALAATLMAQGRRVAVVKPCQTGVNGDEPSDIRTVTALSGCTAVHELVRLDDPLAPDSAARLRGLTIPTVDRLVEQVADCADGQEVTLVEGAGGIAVRLDTTGGTILTLAAGLRAAGHDVGVLVVTGLALGTLNHTELTVGAVRAAAFEPVGLVLGDVPGEPGLAERCNLDDLPRVTGLPVLASLPHGVGDWPTEVFRAAAPGWVTRPDLLT